MTTLYLRKSIGLLALVVCLATLGLGLSATARQPTFTTFDAPGAGTGADQGTIPFDITPAGEITGFTRDAAFARHGFVRARNGAIAVFDAPDAGTGAGQGTRAYSQNPAGAITGWYSEATDVVHAYVRAANGSFTVFDAPGAGTGPFPQGTLSYGGINPAGAIAGYYTDDSNVSHGFLRAPDGAFTTFDAPGAGTGDGQGTFAPIFGFNINPQGTITGNYIDASNVSHGFVRAPNGTLTTFDAPGAGTTTDSFQGTYPSSINQAGAICGAYLDESNEYHGFVRAPNGTLTTFDAPGAGTTSGSFQGTYPSSINQAGAICGAYLDESNVYHGFVRAPNGTLTTFDAPGAGTTTDSFQGTVAFANNPAGAITGYYLDENNVNHGFVRAHNGTFTTFDAPGAGTGAFQGTVA